jgi:hypothetical protein
MKLQMPRLMTFQRGGFEINTAGEKFRHLIGKFWKSAANGTDHHFFSVFLLNFYPWKIGLPFGSKVPGPPCRLKALMSGQI